MQESPAFLSEPSPLDALYVLFPLHSLLYTCHTTYLSTFHHLILSCTSVASLLSLLDMRQQSWHACRHLGDELPQTPAGITVSVADKVDSLVGLIGAGCAPTASADPSGLRRIANGLLQVISGWFHLVSHNCAQLMWLLWPKHLSAFMLTKPVQV